METPTTINPPPKASARANIFRRAVENPVILKELRAQMRGRRAYINLTIYLLLIGMLISVIYYFMASTQAQQSQWDPGYHQIVGKTIFSTVVLFEFLVIGFIGPASTAGAITSEHERQT